MFVPSLCILLVATVVAASPAVGARHPPLLGVDPNTQSCDPEGHVFLLLPHFEDCNKYYKCVHGNEVERKCSGNTIFDFEEQVCNWRWATKCWLREIIDGSGDGDYSGYTGLEEENFDVNSAPEVAPASFHPTLDCNRAESASLQLSYMNDCQRFWRCHNGKITAAYCSDGLFFNAQTQMCDFEANVKCQTQMEDELQGEFIVYK